MYRFLYKLVLQLWLLVTMIYVTFRKIKRSIEWFFLSRIISRNVRFACLLGRYLERIFVAQCGATKVSTALYFRPGYGLGESTDNRRTLYWEAPLTFTVWAAEGPLCGMAVELRRNALCIRQLQGVRGAKFPPEMCNWPLVFVSACIRLARLSGIRYVRLYRADQSPFYKFPLIETKPDESYSAAEDILRKRMRQRYDGTARKAKMRLERRWGEWTHPNYTRTC